MDTQPIPTDRRPIGFWLKLIDELINARFASMLGTRQLSRRHWQVLNVLHQGNSTIAEIDERVRPFLDDAEPTTRPVVDDLIARNWATMPAGQARLTPEGEALFDRLLREVSEHRAMLVAGITPDDYATTIAVLQRMAHNLGWSDSGSA